MPSHPSTFWFAEARILPTVHVDDLMLSGPGNQDAFWKSLMERAKLEDPEPVFRFLGRYQDFHEVTAPAVDIREYFVPQVKVPEAEKIRVED